MVPTYEGNTLCAMQELHAHKSKSRMMRLALIMLLVLIGCARTRSEPVVTPAAHYSESPARAPSAIKCVLRLLEMPAYTDLAIPAGSDVESHPINEMYPLAADAERYTLHFSRADGTASITVSGGIGDHIQRTEGPWPINHPDVRVLVKHVASGS